MLTFTAPAGLMAARELRRHAWPAPSTNRKAMRKDETDVELGGQGIRRLLYDLMALSGQQAGPGAALELLVGEILTRTSVEPEGEDLHLCVTGLLPACAPGASPAAALAAVLDEDGAAGLELLWHADLGRYIAVRRIALRHLSDERSVMDQILDTADLAQRCADQLGAG